MTKPSKKVDGYKLKCENNKRDRSWFLLKGNHFNLSLLIMSCNGLAKLRGRFKRINLSKLTEASLLNFLYIFNKPI